jgi:hypothetical protein
MKPICVKKGFVVDSLLEVEDFGLESPNGPCIKRKQRLAEGIGKHDDDAQTHNRQGRPFQSGQRMAER